MRNFFQKILIFLNIFLVIVLTENIASGIDSEVTRKTLAKIKGVRVVVEELQPNFKKYANKFNITQENILKIVENKLRQSGIRVLDYNDWLKTPGRPILYINVNTHENQRYWYAYDIKFELIQVVSLESNPTFKTMASTWAVNVTGVLNIGNLNIVNHEIIKLTDRFIDAYLSANR